MKKNLGVDAKPLTVREETLMGTITKSSGRAKACCEQLISTVKIPGFVYTAPWLVKEMARKGFTQGETDDAIDGLIERGTLIREGLGVKLRT